MLPIILECLEEANRNQLEINSCYKAITDLLVSEVDASMKSVKQK